MTTLLKQKVQKNKNTASKATPASETGGKYIFEGSYGCAFNPALPCEKTGKRKGLGKVFHELDHLKVEEKIQAFIKKVDPKHEATVPFYGSCRVDISKIRPTDQLHKCDLLNEYSVSKKLIHQMMFKYGGDDLDIVMNNIAQNNKYTNVSSKRKYASYTNFTFDTLIVLLLPLVAFIFFL